MIALPSAVWWGNDTPTPVPTPDIGGEAGDFVEYIMENTDLKAWDVWFFGNSDSFGGTWGVKPSDLLPQLMGGQGSSNDAVSLVWGLITGMLSGVVGVFLMYIGLAVIKSLINGMRPKGTLPQTASSVIRVFAGLTALAAVWGAVTSCKECLLGLGKLSGVLAPVLLGLLTLFGMGSSAIAQQAAMTLYGSTVIGCLSKLVLPLAAAGGIMGALGAFGKELHTDGFGKLCHKACKWIIALISAAYFIMTAVRGISGGAADSVLLRTTKLAAGGLPFAGGLVSDSLETAFACMRLVKNAVGSVAVLLALGYVAKPVILLLLHGLALRMAAALSVPLGAGGLSPVFVQIADMLSVILSILVAAAVLLCVCVAGTALLL
ncbi:MAG TPA: hypothetical protein PLM48_00295 [Clostridia bacterium]|nr:hypothetical protein [Clostridia bacterium]